MTLAPEILLDFDRGIIHSLPHFHKKLQRILLSRCRPFRLIVRQRHKELVRKRQSALHLLFFFL